MYVKFLIFLCLYIYTEGAASCHNAPLLINGCLMLCICFLWLTWCFSYSILILSFFVLSLMIWILYYIYLYLLHQYCVIFLKIQNKNKACQILGEKKLYTRIFISNSSTCLNYVLFSDFCFLKKILNSTLANWNQYHLYSVEELLIEYK